jgi:inner membrane protein
MVGASAAARADVRAAAAAQGIAPEDVMVAPVPADPFRGQVVVMTRDEYYTGDFDWLAEPRLRLGRERIPRPRGVAFELASQDPAARRFLVWSRYPAIDLEPDRGAIRVTFTDVRYRSQGQLEGPKVYLPTSAVESGGD